MTQAKKQTFHEVLKTILDGRTQRWLSEKSDIQESEISRICTGRLIPTDEQIEKIKKAFPENLQTLLG